MGHLFDANGVRIEPYTYKNQYHLAYIRDINNNPHTVGIHQLVAMTYDPNWFPGCVVHHIDEDKFNNIDQNLISTNRSNHAKLHNPYKYADVVMTCQICGKNLYGLKKNNIPIILI